MPVGTMIVAGASLAVGAGSAYMEHQSNKKAAKEAKKANRYERQKNELQSARQKMEALRAGRQALAETQQNAFNQGAEGSSIGQGGAGSVFSQTMGNLSFLDQYGYFSDQASKHLQKSANAQAKGQMWGAVSNLGFKVYGMTGGLKFKGPTPPPPPKAG